VVGTVIVNQGSVVRPLAADRECSADLRWGVRRPDRRDRMTATLREAPCGSAKGGAYVAVRVHAIR
jgi:hypothetical protein